MTCLFSNPQARKMLIAGLVGLASCFASTLSFASDPQFQNLSPVQVYAAPQIRVEPPQPLPDPPEIESIFTDAGDPPEHSDQAVSYDILDAYFWNESDTNTWRRRRIAETSPGLRGYRGGRRPQRLKPAGLVRTSDSPWTFGTSNWRYAGEQGLDVTLGSARMAVPAWGNSVRLGGISISQSSAASFGDANSWQYSMAVGALDNSSGISQGDLNFGPTASNTVLRYGLTPQLTLESQLELAPQLLTSGFGGKYATVWGDLSAGVARASNGPENGWRYQAAYSIEVFDDLQLSWLNERHTTGFSDLSRYQNAASPAGIRQQWTATVPLGRWGDVSGVYERAHSSLGGKQQTFGLTQQFWYSPNLRIGLEAQRELVGGDYDIGLRFSVPIF